MLRLSTTVRRERRRIWPPPWPQYPSIEAARAGASALMREDRVLRVMSYTVSAQWLPEYRCETHQNG